MIEKHESNNTPFPQDLIYNVLIRAFVSKKANTFLVTGFPHSLDQALYVEKFIKEIKMIISFENSRETSISRKHNMSKESFDENELIRNYDNYKVLVFPVVDFYQKYGVVRTINSDLSENQIYENLKEALFPEVYCIIGKKYSGKTEISKVLCERTGMKCINFPAFLKETQIAKKINDDEFVINQFINRLREEESKKVLVEGFPMKKEYYTIFVQNCKNFKKIFYLNVSNNEASERMRKLGIHHTDFIGCSELNKALTEFENKNSYLDFLRKKCGKNFLELNVNKVFKLVVEDLIQKIAPNVLIFNSGDANGKAVKENLVNYFMEKLGYQFIDVEKILKEYSSRNHELGNLIEDAYGKRTGTGVSNSLKIEALKPILFNEKNDKFILVNYPDSQESIKEFEEKICKILRYVYVSKISPLNLKLESSEIEIYFKKNNRFFIYNQDDIHEYIINDILGCNRDFNIAYGLPFAGDTLINGHLEKNYRHKLIDLNKFIEQIKIQKAGAEGDPESIVVDLQMLLTEFKEYLKEIPKNQKICIENLLNPVIVDYDGASKFMEILGRPRFFFEIFCTETALIDKYKTKNEIADEIGEEQKAEFEKSLEIPKKIIELLREFSYKTIKIDTSFSDWKSLNNFDFNFGRNLIVVKHDYSICLENSLYLAAAAHRVLYVNVPYLIYRQFYLNNSWAERLENSYDKKNLNIPDFDDFERKIYKVYNPLHFQESVVNELILFHINENSKENEDNDNMIILTGYINFDLLQENNHPFNLPMYEIKKVLNIGKKNKRKNLIKNI
jgi:adenylate kinase family enzyme